MNQILVPILKHGAVVAGGSSNVSWGRRLYAPRGLCLARTGTPSVHAHKVDMSCVYPGWRNAAEPAPLAILPGGLGSFMVTAGHHLGCLSIHTAAPSCPRGARRKDTSSKKTFVKLESLELGNSHGAGLSTMSSTASSRNLDSEQSTVTWTRYLSCPVLCFWVSLPSESNCLSSP